MEVNRTILVGGMVIIGFGVITAIVNNRPKTPVFVGGVGVVLIASILDLMGPTMAKIGGGIIALAVVTVVMVEGPALAKAIQQKPAILKKGSIQK